MNCFTQNSLEAMLLLYRYLSQKAGSIKKDDTDYWITTAFKHAVSIYYGQAIVGTLYSSAMSENNCLNVALDKQVVDEGFLKMHGAIVYKVSNHPYLPERSLYPCSHYAKVDSYGNFNLQLFSQDKLFN
jgi:hypothetical protein